MVMNASSGYDKTPASFLNHLHGDEQVYVVDSQAYVFLNHLHGDELIHIIQFVKEHHRFRGKLSKNLPIKVMAVSY